MLDHEPRAGGGYAPRTYALWSSDLGAQVLDLGHMGHGKSLSAIASLNRSGCYQLVALGARDGEFLLASENFSNPIYGLGAVGQYLIGLTRGPLYYHILIFNSSLKLAYSIRSNAEPELLGSLTGRDIIYLSNRTLVRFSLSEMDKEWSLGIPGRGPT